MKGQPSPTKQQTCLLTSLPVPWVLSAWSPGLGQAELCLRALTLTVKTWCSLFPPQVCGGDWKGAGEAQWPMSLLQALQGLEASVQLSPHSEHRAAD